jgi:thermitase
MAPTRTWRRRWCAGYNFYDNNTDTSDVCGHGTAVAGVAAAAPTMAGRGRRGGQAKIMPVRVAYFDSASGGCYAYYSTIASGVTYAADHGARIANAATAAWPAAPPSRARRST